MASSGAPARTDVQRNRAALLDAAVDVLAIAPQASLSEVAARAGLGRATLYRHFESRDELLDAIRSEALTRVGAALGELDLASCDIRTGLQLVGAALVPLGMRFRILLAEGVDADPAFLEQRDATLAPVWGLVQRGINNGELRHTDPAWLHAALAGLLMSAVRAASLGLVDPESVGDLLASTFLEGVGQH